MRESQRSSFQKLATSDTAQQHGQRNIGDDIVLHAHDHGAVYKVDTGLAQLINSQEQPVAVLGPEEANDSVEVQPHEQHGWQILADNTEISHVTTQSRVTAVLQTA